MSHVSVSKQLEKHYDPDASYAPTSGESSALTARPGISWVRRGHGSANDAGSKAQASAPVQLALPFFGEDVTASLQWDLGATEPTHSPPGSLTSGEASANQMRSVSPSHDQQRHDSVHVSPGSPSSSLADVEPSLHERPTKPTNVSPELLMASADPSSAGNADEWWNDQSQSQALEASHPPVAHLGLPYEKLPAFGAIVPLPVSTRVFCEPEPSARRPTPERNGRGIVALLVGIIVGIVAARGVDIVQRIVLDPGHNATTRHKASRD